MKDLRWDSNANAIGKSDLKGKFGDVSASLNDRSVSVALAEGGRVPKITEVGTRFETKGLQHLTHLGNLVNAQYENVIHKVEVESGLYFLKRGISVWYLSYDAAHVVDDFQREKFIRKSRLLGSQHLLELNIDLGQLLGKTGRL
jgi:hypothetical protein